MNRLVDKKTLSHKGQATAEFVMMVPFFLVLIVAVIEFSNMYIQAQRVLSVSREATNAAYRDCAGLTSTTDLNNCVSRVINGVAASGASPEVKGVSYFAGIILKDFDNDDTTLVRGKILVQVFLWDKNNLRATLASTQFSSSGTLVNGFTTKFHANSNPGNITTGLGTALAHKGTIITGEVFYKYKPMTIIGGLIGNILPGSLYAATIY